MECTAKGRGSPCLRGPPARRCGLCGAVAYCSKAHQTLHWADHKGECSRLAEQMRLANVLSDFPFTFSSFGKEETRCLILTSMGLHQIGLWRYECSCSPLVASSKSSWIHDNWDLPSTLCPCSGPRSLIPTCLTDWKDYYQWRCLPLHSPVALLLHWPLSVYHSVQVSGIRKLISAHTNRLCIHYLGPEKELSQLGVFGELRALFPGVQLYMDFIGPAVPQFRDGEIIELCSYVHCSEESCSCKDLSPDPGSGSGGPSTVTVKLHKGLYHERHENIVKENYPDLVIASNAGLAAYSNWLPTIELLRKTGTPAIFGDFCEEAAQLAASCIKSLTGEDLKLPVQLNPFRQPMAVEDSALYLPCYSNCFLFGM